MKFRRLIFSVFAICSLAVSCSKTDVAGIESSEESLEAVRFSANLKANAISSTKAGLDNWSKQKIYIYAFPTNTIPDGDSPSILLNNVEATAPDATPQESSDKLSIEVYRDPQNHIPYYYTADKTTYDFYAYYVDNAYAGAPQSSPNPAITEGSNVKLPITLDGSQDILIASTDKEADVYGHGIEPSNAYSAYSARKGVKPNLVFKHLLSRFVFCIIAGNTEGTMVRIKSITLESNSTADLLIVEKDKNTGLSNPGTQTTFTLKPVAGGTAISDFAPQLRNPQVFDPVEDRIGESIMTIPDQKHKLVITMQQMDGATPIGDEFKYIYDLKPSMVKVGGSQCPDTSFLSGYQYNVYVVVYGREKILVDVTLTPWGERGTITIDNDTEWGDEPKAGVKTTDGKYLYFYGPIQVGTEVKVWDSAQNKMTYAAPGDYTFAQAQSGVIGVTLSDNEGKTVVSTVTLQQP